MAKKKNAQNVLVWILMALLIAGLGGFGIDGFLSQQVNTIGAVGGRPIGAQTYARGLQTEMRAVGEQLGQPVTFEQALAFGLDARVRAQLVRQAALENEAERVGISVGDRNVLDTITAITAFHGPTGGFDMDTYRFQLDNLGLTPTEFEEDMRRDAARGILEAATAAGIETPANLRGPLVDHYATRHAFDLFTLTEDDLPNLVAEPTEEAVQAHYEANLDAFTAPETRRITYAALTPDMLIDSVEVDEETIRALYDERIGDYVQPERRLVERLVFSDEAAAQAAMARIQAGEVSFDGLVAERNLTLEDVDLGDVSERDLGAAGAAVFALDEPGLVTGPHPSSLGPALFRMNAILNAQETPYEAAREDLRAELAGDRARRAIADQRETLDDLLAGGATVEDMAAETAMELGTMNWTAESGEGISGYAEFNDVAAAISTEDFPELMSLSDGGLFTMRLDSITPPTPRPLDEVRDAATAGARQAAVDSALLDLAQTLSAELASMGPEAFAEANGLAAESFEEVTRLDTVPQVPASMLETILSSDAGTPVVTASNGRALIAFVRETLPADEDDAQTQRLVGIIDQQMGQGLAQDVYDYFARALETEAGIELDQAAINAVHSSFN
jgi:peptidyl-prolyl cis-trans isomerase D